MIDSLTSGLFIPLSLPYLVARSGASLAHVGLVPAVLCYSAAQMIHSPVSNALFGVGNAVSWAVLTVAALLTIPAMLLLAPRLPDAALTGVRSIR
jgi:hypothetical protein